MPNGIDRYEDDILVLGAEVLERLLWDHSRPTFYVDGNERHHHIYWATDNYESLGEGFQFFDEIQIGSITQDNRHVVRPRAVKSKQEQVRRTRDKAEVFTPSWICNAQNNMVDEAWFSRPNVFNEEYIEDGIHKWRPTEGKIVFPEGKDWTDYVWDKRLEVTCGEAPYLVSRCDTTTGEAIESLSMRIGLIDRKLRVVGENVESIADWIYWAKCAIKSTYGFDWQGDNIWLAREAVLLTFIEYYNDFCERVMHKKQALKVDTLLSLAYIISWNIWQMDGVEYTLPMSGSQAVEAFQPSLFDMADIPQYQPGDGVEHRKMYALVAEWKKEGRKPSAVFEYRRLLQSDALNLNVIVGNPPYQMLDGGGGHGSSAIPIYRHFVEVARELTRGYLSMIMPSRWMIGGRSLGDFRESMITDRRISRLYDFYDACACFDNVNIKGGVCYFLLDKSYDGPCRVCTKDYNGYEQESLRFLKEGDEPIFIRDSKLIEIKNKVAQLGEASFSTIMSAAKPYGVRSDFFKNPAKYGLPPIRSEKLEGDITIIGLDEKFSRAKRYVALDYPLPRRECLEDYKLFVPRNYGTGRMGELAPNVVCAVPFEACTETFLRVGPFKSAVETQNCNAYMKTKLFLVLLGISKQTQAGGGEEYRYVPVQDFSVLWTDEMLYQKYGITEEEQAYIDQILGVI